VPHSDDIAVLHVPALAAPAATEPLPEERDAGEDLDALTARLDQLDRELLALIRHRTAVARQLPAARAAAGRTGYRHADELQVARRFAALGPYGADLSLLLLRLAR
jgi:chorismate mutase